MLLHNTHSFISCIAPYGSKTWTVVKSSEKILRLAQAKGVWKTRYIEIYKLYDDIAFSIFLHLKRLQWAVHMERMDYSCIPKKLEDVSDEESPWKSKGKMGGFCSEGCYGFATDVEPEGSSKDQ